MRRFLLPVSLALVGVLVVAVGVGRRNALPPGATAADIEFSIQPSFLEPGPLMKGRAYAPVEVGNAADGAEGVVAIQLWNTTALVTYRRGPDGNLTTLGVVPLSHDGTSDGWNIWRHRHAYIYARDQGYFWSTLSDERMPIREALGKTYDEFLKAVWSYWAVVGLEAERLRKTPRAAPVPREGFRRTVRVALQDGRLARPASVGFQLNPWHLPLRVRMDVRSSTTTSIVEMVDGFHWTFDMDDWRRRHGYRRTLFSGYQWVEGFPAPFAMNDAVGRQLDHLLDKTMAYWAEAVALEVVSELDLKVASTVPRSG